MPHRKAEARRAFSAVLVSTSVCWMASLSPSRAAEVEDTVVLAAGGDPAPDATCDLFSVEPPVLHGGGQAAFISSLDGCPAGSGVYRASPGGLVQIARSGDPSPDGNGNLGHLRNAPLLVNGAGQVAFHNYFDNTFGGFDESVVLIADGSGPPSIIARGGQTPPGAPGPLQDLLDPSGLNQAGQVCFPAFVQGSIAVFRGDGSPGSLVSIGVSGQALPGGGSLLVILGGPASAINASGQVTFQAVTASVDVGIFVGDGTNPLIEIVRSGEATPSGNGIFSTVLGFVGLSNSPLNDRGEVAFVSFLENTSGGLADYQGLFLGDGSTLVELARRGEATPDGNGSFLDFGLRIDLDDAGRVIFQTTVTGASGGATDGLFLADRNGVEQIVRRNDPAPGGGLFSDVLESSLSAAGVTFVARVNLEDGGSTNDTFGLFFYDGKGVRSIVRKGDTIAGSGTVSDVAVHLAAETEGIEANAVSDDGEVAYRFTSGGNFSIAVWAGATLLADGFESGDTSAWQ